MRFKGGPHENPARCVVTIFLPKSAHAHPNSNNPPGRRDLEAITIAGGASSSEQPQPRSSRDRAIYDLQESTRRQVRWAGCRGRRMYPESSGNRAQAAQAALESGALAAPAPRQGGRWRKAQSTKHRRPSPSCVRCWKAQVPKNQWFSTPRAAPRRHSKPAWPMNTKARWRVPLASSSADVGAAGTVCSLFWCR